MYNTMEYHQLCVLIIALLTLSTDVCCQVITASRNPLPVGSNVTLQLSPQTTIIVGIWSFQTTTITLWYPGGETPSPAWQNRITFNQNSSQLSISRLKVEDSGLYILQGLNPNLRAEFTLSVQERILNVRLGANNTNLVELNDTAVLTCSVSNGSSLSYHWLNGSSEVKASTGVQIGNGGSTLTIASVTRYDQGPFRCNVSNDISYGISPSILLNISYGPSDPTLTVTPMKAAYRTGSNITLSCSAASNPPPGIQWVFEGRYLNQYSPELRLDNTAVNQTGNYKCLVNNPVTLRFTSVSMMIRIVDPISAVDVKYVGKPPILSASLNLSCEVTGPVVFIRWWKNGQELMADNRTVFSMDNKTVTVGSIQLSDNGDSYQCQAFNSVSNMTSPANYLVVNYGPGKPVITGKSMALTGNSVTFNCSASSQPPSSFKWFFNGSQVATGSEFRTGLLNMSNNGMYTCMAYNNVTEQNTTMYTMLTVLAPVTMTTVKVVGPQPIENQSFTLSCMSAGSVDSILWIMNNKPLYADNGKVFSMKNATLTFNPVLQYDMGNYQCAASNPLSNMTSESYHLVVNYGPEKPAITGPTLAMTGKSVTFNCSASSQPPSSYKWFFNGSQVATGSEFMTGLLNMNNSRMYTCMAYNNVTAKNNTAYTTLTVIDPISAVQIKIPLKPAVEGHAFTLSCDVTGPVVSKQWWRNGQELMADNTTIFSMNNNTVTLNSILRSNNGDYQCQASNLVSNVTSVPYRVIVNYGPENPMIDGPSMAMTGHNVTFNCSASSEPPCSYKWFFNDTLVATGSEFMTGLLNLNSSGMYTCVAYNDVTEKNSTAQIMLTVIDPITSVSISDGGKLPILNGSFTMTCNVVGDPISIFWWRNGMPLYADNTNFTTDNKTLTLNPIRLSDNGKYQCVASNAVSTMTSPAHMILVNYGPENAMIHGPTFGETGRSVIFHCSASSQPPSSYQWFFNGSQVANNSQFMTGPLTYNSSGTYSCVAYNNITNQSSTAYTMLTVIEAIKSVMVKASTIPIANQELTLTCEIKGPHSSIYWLKDNTMVNVSSSFPDSNTSLYTVNNSLHFNPVTVSSNGNYQCVATNQYGPHRSLDYELLANYGPLKVNISGPSTAVIGTTISVTLNCTADSQPTSKFMWLFNNKSVATSANLGIYVQNQSTGNYTCIAKNPVTNISLSNTFSFSVIGHASTIPLLSRMGLTVIAMFALSLPVINDWILH